LTFSIFLARFLPICLGIALLARVCLLEHPALGPRPQRCYCPAWQSQGQPRAFPVSTAPNAFLRSRRRCRNTRSSEKFRHPSDFFAQRYFLQWEIFCGGKGIEGRFWFGDR